MAWNNLDLKAAEAARAAAAQLGGCKPGEAYKLCLTGANILAYQGPTALFLYLRMEGPRRKHKTAIPAPAQWAEAVARISYGLLVDTARLAALDTGSFDDREKFLENSVQRAKNVGSLGTDLIGLLEAKRLLERFLVYLKCHLDPMRADET